jgi:hypothetical protein
MQTSIVNNTLIEMKSSQFDFVPVNEASVNHKSVPHVPKAKEAADLTSFEIDRKHSRIEDSRSIWLLRSLINKIK